jgi:hypothetical protein
MKSNIAIAINFQKMLIDDEEKIGVKLRKRIPKKKQ